MSTDKVQQKLQNTISDYISSKKTVGKVIAVNGLWGTGKTYLWQSFFQGLENENSIFPTFVEKIVGIVLLLEFVFTILLLLVIYQFFPSLSAVFYSIKENLLFVTTTIVVIGFAVYWVFIKYTRWKLRTYSYISLFGINSLDDFKLNLFQNMTKIERSLKKDKYLIKPFAYTKKYLFPYWRTLNLGFIRLDLTSLAKNGFNAINNSLICIDDLERRGSNLDIKDIMGLVSFLKEQKQCTIVLLYNDDILQNKQDIFDFDDEKQDEPQVTANNQIENIKKELERLKEDINEKRNKEEKKASKQDFDILLEKVIDLPLIFKPTPEICLELALKVYQEKSPNLKCDNEIRKEMVKSINLLSLINIRIIVLILGYLDKIKEDIKEPWRLKYLISRLVLFVCCRYIISEQFPDWSLLKDLDRYSKVRKREDENLLRMFKGNKIFKRCIWIDTFRAFGVNDLNIIDKYLIDYIDTGYSSDKNKLTNVLNNTQFMKEIDSIENALSEFWNQYGLLEKTPSDLKETLEKIFNDNKFLVTLHEIDNLANLIESIWGVDDAKRVIDRYISDWKEYYMYTDKHLKKVPLISLKSITLKERLEKFDKELERVKESYYESNVVWCNQKISHNDVMNLDCLTDRELEIAVKTNSIPNLLVIINIMYSRDVEKAELFYERIERIFKDVIDSSIDIESVRLNNKRRNSFLNTNYTKEIKDISDNKLN